MKPLSGRWVTNAPDKVKNLRSFTAKFGRLSAEAFRTSHCKWLDGPRSWQIYPASAVDADSAPHKSRPPATNRLATVPKVCRATARAVSATFPKIERRRRRTAAGHGWSVGLLAVSGR